MIATTFIVNGTPVPKERPRRGRGGRFYTPQATRNYEAAVGLAARQAGLLQPYDGPVGVSLHLWFPDRRRRDLDNAAKAILDGLNGIAYDDDAQVADLRVIRSVDHERPRAEVTVEALP